MDMKSKHKTREALFMYINYPLLYMVYHICFIIFSKIYDLIWDNINVLKTIIFYFYFYKLRLLLLIIYFPSFILLSLFLSAFNINTDKLTNF